MDCKTKLDFGNDILHQLGARRPDQHDACAVLAHRGARRGAARRRERARGRGGGD
jgi:hypothetical protein